MSQGLFEHVVSVNTFSLSFCCTYSMTERGVCLCLHAHLFKLFVDNFVYGIGWPDLPSQNGREHVPQRDHAQNLPTGRKPDTRLSHTLLHFPSVLSFRYF